MCSVTRVFRTGVTARFTNNSFTLLSQSDEMTYIKYAMRFAVTGVANRRVFRLVATKIRSKRDSRVVEILGSFDPKPDNEGIKHMTFNSERVRYWLGLGARPSQSVALLLGKANILPPLPFLGLSDARVPVKPQPAKEGKEAEDSSTKK